MNSVVSSTPAIVTNQGENQTQQIVRQHMNMDENSGGGGTLLHTSDEGKQLVSLGDGQYFELPEGYTLIQTDEGYIIGQPGATFVQVITCFFIAFEFSQNIFVCNALLNISRYFFLILVL